MPPSNPPLVRMHDAEMHRLIVIYAIGWKCDVYHAAKKIFPSKTRGRGDLENRGGRNAAGGGASPTMTFVDLEAGGG